jgi:hypothetical protein
MAVMKTTALQRAELADVFEQSPSLERHGRGALAKIYQRAVRFAANEARLSVEAFPSECPYSFDQIMDEGFLPE